MVSSININLKDNKCSFQALYFGLRFVSRGNRDIGTILKFDEFAVKPQTLRVILFGQQSNRPTQVLQQYYPCNFRLDLAKQLCG